MKGRRTSLPRARVRLFSAGGRCARIVSILAGLVIFLSASGSVRGGVLVLAEDRVVHADDVHMDDGQLVAVGPDHAQGTRLHCEQLILTRFDALPVHVLPRAWLCLRDGRRLKGEHLKIGARDVSLIARGRSDIAVLRDDLAGLFFSICDPELNPPDVGVRIISATGDVLDAAGIELTEAGVAVDMGPDMDPVFLTRERVAGLLWAEPPGKKTEGAVPAKQLVELRDGQRLTGKVVSIDQASVRLQDGDVVEAIERREVKCVWWARCQVQWAEQGMQPAPVSSDRPVYRIGRDASGGPLRIGRRVYEHGFGLRGPARIDILVPDAARWFLVDVGADCDAAAFARMSWEVLVDGERRGYGEDLRAGEERCVVAVSVSGSQAVTLAIEPAGMDPTGCLGDFGDAVFIGQ